jgi:hypothetical protein
MRYVKYATEQSLSNFLVEDPDWAVDFAPNGRLPYPLSQAQNKGAFVFTATS